MNKITAFCYIFSGIIFMAFSPIIYLSLFLVSIPILMVFHLFDGIKDAFQESAPNTLRIIKFGIHMIDKGVEKMKPEKGDV